MSGQLSGWDHPPESAGAALLPSPPARRRPYFLSYDIRRSNSRQSSLRMLATLTKREQLSKVTAQDVQSGVVKPDNGGGLPSGT